MIMCVGGGLCRVLYFFKKNNFRRQYRVNFFFSSITVQKFSRPKIFTNFSNGGQIVKVKSSKLYNPYGAISEFYFSEIFIGKPFEKIYGP